MPQRNRSEKNQPPQSIRITRSRSRLPNAPKLLTGLDDRGRPIDPLVPEPDNTTHNPTANQSPNAWQDQEKQVVEQSESAHQKSSGGHIISASSISTMTPPPSDLLSVSPSPNISPSFNANPKSSSSGIGSILTPTHSDRHSGSPTSNIWPSFGFGRTNSNAHIIQTGINDSQNNIDVAELRADYNLAFKNYLTANGVLEPNNNNEPHGRRNEVSEHIAVPDERIDRLSPGFPIFESLSSIRNEDITSDNIEIPLTIASSRVPLSEVNQNSLNSRGSELQLLTEWDHGIPQGPQQLSEQENLSPRLDEFIPVLVPDGPTTQPVQQTIQFEQMSQTGDEDGDDEPSDLSRPAPGEDLFAPRLIPSASGLPPDWRPGRPIASASGRHIDNSTESGSASEVGSEGGNETSSDDESIGPVTVENLVAPCLITSASGLPQNVMPGYPDGVGTVTASNSDDVIWREVSQQSIEIQSDSFSSDRPNALPSNGLLDAPSLNESDASRRSPSTQTEDLIRDETRKRSRSNSDEEADSPPQAKRQAFGTGQIVNDERQYFPEQQCMTSAEASWLASGDINLTQTAKHYARVEQPLDNTRGIAGEVPGQYGSGIRPRMNYDWWEQFHVCGVLCTQVHGCAHGVCHECHEKWHRDWLEYFNDEDELDMFFYETDDFVEMLRERQSHERQSLEIPMGRSLRTHPARVARERLQKHRVE
ncbi:hypothetical protein BGZ63DRAFT_403117 [Mariannaea sp. PMI_226]|nr:hypothetical protein BGZ63DRAFT_403117 [Mariannaea sp. PMI_226]